MGGARRTTQEEGEGGTRKTGQATEKEAKAVKWEHEHENVKLPGGIMRVNEAGEAVKGEREEEVQKLATKKPRESEKEREKKTRTN